MIEGDPMDEGPHDEASEYPAMDAQQLVGYVMELERQAVSYRNSDLADEQATAIEFYEAGPFGDEVEGRSQVVVPVVQEVCDYMSVSVLRSFVSGDRVVEFSAKEEEMADQAEEAGEAINHIFMREQDGYKVLHDWLKTGLIEKVGVVKTACCEETKRKRRNVTVSPEEFGVLMEQANVIRATEQPDGSVLATVEEEATVKRYIDLPIPNYEFLFSQRTRHEDEADYLCHRSLKTSSELVEMGFDRERVEALTGVEGDLSLDGRENATWDDESLRTQNDDIPGMKRHLLREEYVRIDYDGDGKAELLRVYRVHNVILEAEEVEDQPFVVFSPFPRPHRMVGNGLADKVMDIQRNKSVVMRNTFDGFYMTISPRFWLPVESTTEDTIDDLLTVAPGVIVRGRGAPPQPLNQAFALDKSLALLESLSGEQESRTGITRLNQGLDSDTLNKTASGQAQLQATGQQMEEFVARNFAEALARLFVKKLRLMIEHGDPLSMRVGGEYKQVDPSTWTDDMDVTIRVGLGSGKKEARVSARMAVIGLQAQAYDQGLVTKHQLYNSGAGIVRDTGLGDPNDFFTDPESEEGKALEQAQSQQPDPEAAKAQADMAKAQLMAQVQKQIADDKLNFEREKAQAELELARERMAAELALQREKAFLQAETSTHIASNRPGGSLAA